MVTSFPTTEKQVISRRRKNENVCEMLKMKTAHAKRAKLLLFTIKYANLLPSSWWLRKLPTTFRCPQNTYHH